MYKLCLIQRGDTWEWYLQQIVPADMPFAPERGKYFGFAKNIEEAFRQAKMNSTDISYVYLDRHAGTRV